MLLINVHNGQDKLLRHYTKGLDSLLDVYDRKSSYNGAFIIYVTQGLGEIEGGPWNFFLLREGGLCNFFIPNRGGGRVIFIPHYLSLQIAINFLYPRIYRKQVFQSTT